MVTQIFEIRDSIEDKLRNDTIKDLQTRFDHETAIHAKDQTIIRWQWGIMILALVLLAGIGLYLRRRYLNKIKLQGYQMQINDCLNQIDALKATGSDDQRHHGQSRTWTKQGPCALRRHRRKQGHQQLEQGRRNAVPGILHRHELQSHATAKGHPT